MKRNQLRALLGGLSFTTALFVFQACYGMPQDMQDDVRIQGKVVSRTTSRPVEGIKVESEVYGHYGVTDSQGSFEFYTPWRDSLKLTIEDVDPDSNGDYASKDTILVNPDNQVFLNIDLEEK
ncbi:MAG: hypothetical protein KAR16_06925 [Bacteroidales bacterium]|nr:hypothetical protein [Bacteroidales bacterium]